MEPCDLAPGYIRAIAPYQPGKPISELAREMGMDEARIIKLASNENPRGVSPRARRAIEAALPELARYPDGNGFELKEALSRRHGIPQERIVLGNGSHDRPEMAPRPLLAPGPGRGPAFGSRRRGRPPRRWRARRRSDVRSPAAPRSGSGR